MTDSLPVRMAKALIQVSTDGGDDSVENILVIPLIEAVQALCRTIWPADPEPPGVRLRAFLADRDIPQARFAEGVGVSAKHLCHLINGKVALTHAMAIRLEAATGVSAAEWNIAEAAWRDYLIRQRQELIADD